MTTTTTTSSSSLVNDLLLSTLTTARNVTQDSTSFAFVWRHDNGREQRYGGLLRYLQARLYPNYKPPERRRHERSSRAMGDRVHRHVAHVVNCVADGECSCEVKRSVRSKIMNKHARALLNTLRSMRIKPIRCEIPIVSEQWSVGTRIDLIGMREMDGRSVLISIKTGYDRHFNRRRQKDAQLQAPLNDWADTPLSHHRAQLLAEYLICRHEYNVVFDECLIMYAAKRAKTTKRAGKLVTSTSGGSDTSGIDSSESAGDVHVEMIPNMTRYTMRETYLALMK